MLNADYHLHSVYSDGSFSVGELFQSAADLGLSEISVTDHDSTASWNEVADCSQRFGIHAVMGIEISCVDHESMCPVHILGYGITDRDKIERYCMPTRRARQLASFLTVERLNSAGYHIAWPDVQAIAGPSGQVYKQHIRKALVEAGIADDIWGKTNNKLFSQESGFIAPIHYPEASEAVSFVKKSGGFAVLAHPGIGGVFDLAEKLLPYGLDGIEGEHPAHTEADKKIVRRICRKHALFYSGGSDHHGLFEPLQRGLGVALDEGIADRLWLEAAVR